MYGQGFFVDVTESENTKIAIVCENTHLMQSIRITKTKIRIMTTAIISPLTSVFLTLDVLTQAATKKRDIKYRFF